MPGPAVRPVLTLTIGDGDFDLRDLVRGFERAIERFHAETATGLAKEPDSRFRAKAALFEALAWTDSIEQLLSRGPADRGGNPGWEQNLGTNQGDVIRAFIYARGAVHHQWWSAIALHVVPPTDGNEQTNTWLWANLPANADLRRKGARDRQAAYARALHNQPVIDTLSVLHNVFREELRTSKLRERLYLTSG